MDGYGSHVQYDDLEEVFDESAGDAEFLPARQRSLERYLGAL